MYSSSNNEYCIVYVVRNTSSYGFWRTLATSQLDAIRLFFEFFGTCFDDYDELYIYELCEEVNYQ